MRQAQRALLEPGDEHVRGRGDGVPLVAPPERRALRADVVGDPQDAGEGQLGRRQAWAIAKASRLSAPQPVAFGTLTAKLSSIVLASGLATPSVTVPARAAARPAFITGGPSQAVCMGTGKAACLDSAARSSSW